MAQSNIHAIKVIFTLSILMLLLIIANVIVGSVSIPLDAIFNILCGHEVERSSWTHIILDSRIPQCITATLAGAALSVSGLMLQTAFRNPLAGPSILGISTGASLGVAVVMLALGGSISTLEGMSIGGYASILIGALAGAMCIMMLLLLFSTMVESSTMLLIIGILVGYVASSAISLLNYFSTQEGVHSYVIWGLGSFIGVTPGQLPVFVTLTLLALFCAFLLVKPLNAMFLGARYAENLGINMRATRNLLLIVTGVLTAVTTAFCGPIAFVGMVVPHIARLALGTSNHNYLMPVTLLSGCVIALLCNLISVLPSGSVIPINAITPIIGSPIIIYVIINRRKLQYFN